MDAFTLSVLVDPQDRQALLYVPSSVGVSDSGYFYNPRLRVRYPISPEGIPELLAAEAQPVDDASHARYIALLTNGEIVETGMSTN